MVASSRSVDSPVVEFSVAQEEKLGKTKEAILFMEKIVLFGNASMAKSIYSVLNYDPRYKVVAFTVDREYITEDTLFGLPVVPFTDVESIYPPDEYKMRITVGYVKVNKLRAERYFQAKEMGYQLVSYISSLALISPEVVIGDK